ncbi:hypothetical protein PSTG_13703 [Puccinia striiformis f. sp. tritici PST-78]|uniref:Uncharacterized protein n=1 Tax=Puccinia striiformis f. sp. tritici PST-78 TaxID=1165861 RepID=A0A0L0V1N3_9BASI|nr:hypothetical protein PSTG_13703 [Puccinia striiformis f. sp. tritici PST-78]
MALYDLDKTKPQPVSSEPHSLLSLSCGHKLMKTFHLYRLLKSPPSDFKNAKSVFESLSTCVTDFSQSPWNRMLITEAAKFDALAGSAEEYLQVLRNITADVHLLGHSLRRAMQLNEATLLEPLPTKTKQTFEEEDKKIKASQPFVHISALPGEVVIIDDPHSYSPFTKVIIACPQEEVCKQLAKTERSEEIRQLIVERTALFLHERQMGARDNVIRDVEWLKQNLTVEILVSWKLQLLLQWKIVTLWFCTWFLDDANALTPEQLESLAKGIEEQCPDADSGFIQKVLPSEKKDLRKRVEVKFRSWCLRPTARHQAPSSDTSDA